MRSLSFDSQPIPETLGDHVDAWQTACGIMDCAATADPARVTPNPHWLEVARLLALSIVDTTHKSPPTAHSARAQVRQLMTMINSGGPVKLFNREVHNRLAGRADSPPSIADQLAQARARKAAAT